MNLKEALTLAILLASATAADSCNQNRALEQRNNGNIGVWTDPDTGCQYLKMGSQSITPRIGKDGQTMCSDLRSSSVEKTGCSGIEKLCQRDERNL